MENARFPLALKGKKKKKLNKPKKKPQIINSKNTGHGKRVGKEEKQKQSYI